MKNQTISAKEWTNENDLALFSHCMTLADAEIWPLFYALHRDKIQVQRQKTAVEKLAVIIQSTFKLSHDKGFALMSLRDLSEESGISLGGIYAYIGSKQQLALMIHQFLPHVFSQTIHLDYPTVSSGKKKEWKNISDSQLMSDLHRMIRGHIFLSEILRSWFFFAYMEAKYLPASVREVALNNEQVTEQILYSLLAQIKERQLIAIDDVFMATHLIKSLLQTWYLKRAKFSKQKIHCEQYTAYIESIIFKGI